MAKLACLLAFLILPLTARADNSPLPVVASFSVLDDMVKQIGGDAITVTTLVGPDGDAHDFQPSPQDAVKLSKSKLVFLNGLGFEPWAQRLLKSAGYAGPVVTASRGIPAQTFTEDGKMVTDPHAWQNLAYGKIYAKNITAALIAALPAYKSTIAARGTAYQAQIAKKDEWVKSQFSGIPPAQRTIITSHDAFGYFGAAYGITFLAPQGISTENEPSARHIAQLMDQIKSKGIKTVFIENLSNPRLITQLARDAGARPGGTLYADALSAPDGPTPTYLGMFDHNVPLMAAAMQEASGTPKSP